MSSSSAFSTVAVIGAGTMGRGVAIAALDAGLNNPRSMLERSGDEAHRPPRVLEDLVAEGHLGRKSGRGFFGYDERGRAVGEP